MNYARIFNFISEKEKHKIMHRKTLYEQLKEISELEKNWDEYDADPISAATIKNTQT